MMSKAKTAMSNAKKLKILGLLLIIVGVLFGGPINSLIATLGLQKTLYVAHLAQTWFGSLTDFVVSTTFIGFNIMGGEVGINLVTFIGIIMLIVF